MITYTFPPHAKADTAITDTERRMAYDNSFLRQCGIAPVPYNCYWNEKFKIMHVFVETKRKRPALRVYVKETEVAEGQTPGWVCYQKAVTT